MGMAASQARLLTITARLADNELRSQTINNAKMRLATESAQASDDYVTALNNARLMFKNMDLTGTSQSQLLTFNSLSSYSPYNTQYGLVNSAGLLLVNESEAKIFEKSGNNLEKFLENHGLKWDTTYFNEDKNLKSRLVSYYMDDSFKLDENDTEGLSFLFSDKDTSALKTLYETYLSKDVSIERANFSTANTEYLSQKQSLYSEAIRDVWAKLGTNKINNDFITEMNSWIDSQQWEETSATSIPYGAKILAYLKNKDINYYSESFQKETENLTINIFAGDWNTSITTKGDGVRASMYSRGQSNESGYTDCTEYDIGTLTFYVDKDNYVKAFKSNSSDKIKYSGSIPSKEISSSDGIQELESYDLKWPNIVDQLLEDGTGLDEDSQFLKSYSKNILFPEDTIKTTTYYKTAVEGQRTLTSEIIGILTSSSDSIDLEKFVDNVASTYTSSYKNVRDSFYAFVFEDGYDALQPADAESDEGKELLELKKNIDSVTSLNDFGAFIQYIHEYQTANDGQPAFTSSFQNIIDAFTVELMLDELGEPKYAWVDTQDSLNEGNADAKAQWYENLFNRMRKGYAVLEDGLASSPEWIEHAFESGIVTMEQVDKSYNWLSIDYKCCANITEDTDNSAAVAIAEAKYNRAMNDIKRKDNMFDMELKNIDTEHNALQTEYDVIKGVIAKNIERTMKFDQSA